jgi:Ca-activated chloride channel family protein
MKSTSILIGTLLFVGGCAPAARCQLVNTGGGPGTIESQVAALDFGELRMRNQEKAKKELEEAQIKAQAALVESGTVSALDIAAPPKAVKEYNEGVALLRSQHSPEAIPHLQNSLAIYPKFVSALNALGMAYNDTDDNANAKAQFEKAVGLDGKFARPVMNLGRLAIAQNDYETAEKYFQKAALLRPTDIDVLTALAYSQDSNHHYEEAIQTVERIHLRAHKGMGNAHYISAAAALALNKTDILERELTFFVQEDPSNPLVPEARHNLEVLKTNQAIVAGQNAALGAKNTQLASANPTSLANSARLKAELKALGDESGQCNGCELEAANSGGAGLGQGAVVADIPSVSAIGPGNSYTIRKVVDEVALFFAVSSHGNMVNDLELSEIQIRDDGRPPEKILLFTPQSKLPLRVGLLVDTSGSVHERFGFEKHAAAKFLQQLLTNPADLAFVAGFSNSPDVKQEFTASHSDLEKGINSLTNGGGTALFDAISYACGKLAAYPDEDRVAKVLVVLSDGEDNSSHTTLRHAISDAEASGVTIYAISTKDTGSDKTDADRVLQALAERSGGQALFPQDQENLHRSFDKLRDIIRSRYLVAYKPADFEPNGKYRPINIIATKNGTRLQVHARKGYHARVASPEAF